MPAASFPTATAGAQPTGDRSDGHPVPEALHFSNTEHCENLDPRSIWSVKPVREAGQPPTKEFDFGSLRLGRGRLPFWLHVMFNAYWEALDFELPLAPAAALAGWKRWIDTSRESPDDIVEAATAPPLLVTQYRVAPRSVVALFHEPAPF